MENYNPGDLDSNSISEAENKQLKNRILSSVEKHKRKEKKLKYVLAVTASIAVLLALGVYFNSEKEVSITDFVKSSKHLKSINSDNVMLILNKGENVNLNEDESTITYSASGKNVNVGTSRSLRQETTANDELVYNTLVVPYGKRSKIQLSDGSTVWINSGSRLIYPAVFREDKREVYIEGEAIFDVTHDQNRPFIVSSENQEIEVLGTVFNVNNYADEESAFTVLKSGRVKISYAGSISGTSTKNLNITPGTFAGYNKKTNRMSSIKVDVHRYFSWREGVFIFKNDDLHTIMRRLSRYYNIDITIDSEKLANETFSGYLDLNDDIEKVIETIKKTTNLKYNRIEKQKISITTN